MSDTPRTDAMAGSAVTGHYGPSKVTEILLNVDGPFVHASFARTLECELAELRADYRRLAARFSDVQRECAQEVAAAKIKLEVALRESALDELAKESQRMGLYDKP